MSGRWTAELWCAVTRLGAKSRREVKWRSEMLEGSANEPSVVGGTSEST